MKRIAIPIKNKVLSHRFQQCDYFKIYTAHDVGFTFNKNIIHGFKNEDDIIKMFQKEKVDIVIAQRMQEHTLELLAQYKIQVYIEVSNNDPEQLLTQLRNGQLFSGRFKEKMLNN